MLAASGRAIPHHCDGFMRQQKYHLRRILTVQPGDDPRIHNDFEYYSLAMQSPLAEYIILEARAEGEGLNGRKTWRPASCQSGRCYLQQSVAFSQWNAAPLLRELRAAEAKRSAREPTSTRRDLGMCGLAERGRIAAARAQLRGEDLQRGQKPARNCSRSCSSVPQPQGDELSEATFEEIAAEIARLKDGVPEDERITAADLLGAAQRQRGTAAPGPDGWSGEYLRRLATLYPRDLAEILWRDYTALTRGMDPMRVMAVTEATVGGLAKPAGGNRPIVISRITSRCILSYVTTSARSRLRSVMEAGRQFGPMGVTEALLPPLVMAARCSAASVPFAFTDDDFENAFNAVGQAAQARSVLRVASSAPEYAACALRDQCAARGPYDMVLRGRRDAGAGPLRVDKYPRGCPQGSPASPPTFGAVMCEVEDAAEVGMSALRCDTPTAEAVIFLELPAPGRTLARGRAARVVERGSAWSA